MEAIDWDSMATSQEIGDALVELFGDEALCHWEISTDDDEQRVIARAWSKASDETTELYWGDETIRRGTLYNNQTGAAIRLATREECTLSLENGLVGCRTGVIEVDGVACYVD